MGGSFLDPVRGYLSRFQQMIRTNEAAENVSSGKWLLPHQDRLLRSVHKMKCGPIVVPSAHLLILDCNNYALSCELMAIFLGRCSPSKTIMKAERSIVANRANGGRLGRFTAVRVRVCGSDNLFRSNILVSVVLLHLSYNRS